MFQSTITKVIFYCYLASDGKTPATGLSDVSVQISKNCGAYGNPSAGAVNATEISNGAYYVTLSATDTNTLGPLGILATESTIDDVRFDRFVVAGDPYAWLVTNVGALGANLSALVTAIWAAVTDSPGITTLLSRLTSSRAGYLDNLNVGGNVASYADIVSLNLSASKHISISTVPQYAPGQAYTVELRTFNAETGAPVAADSTPTITATGTVSGSLAANLGAISSIATGVYQATYTVPGSPNMEQITFGGSATISSVAYGLNCFTQTVAEPTATFTATDKSNLTACFNKLPSASYLAGTASSNGTGASVDAATFAGGTAFVHTGGKLWVLDDAGNSIATDISNAAGSVTLAASQTATINANVVQWNGASPANLDGSGFPNVHVQAISANVTVGDYATNEDPATLLASSFSPLATESSLATAQGTLNTINTNTSSIPSATTIAAAVWGALTSGLTVANSIGARILAFFGSGNYTAQTGDSFARLGAPAGASVSADIAAVASSAASAASSSASAASSAATAASSAGSAATAAGSAATSAATAATNTGTIITTLDSLENPPIVSDTVQASPAPSPTSCAGSAALNQATNAYGSPSGRQMSILFTSGANQGLAGRVVGSYFSSSVVVLTFEAFPVAPEAGDTFDILGA